MKALITRKVGMTSTIAEDGTVSCIENSLTGPQRTVLEAAAAACRAEISSDPARPGVIDAGECAVMTQVALQNNKS